MNKSRPIGRGRTYDSYWAVRVKPVFPVCSRHKGGHRLQPVLSPAFSGLYPTGLSAHGIAFIHALSIHRLTTNDIYAPWASS